MTCVTATSLCDGGVCAALYNMGTTFLGCRAGAALGRRSRGARVMSALRRSHVGALLALAALLLLLLARLPPPAPPAPPPLAPYTEPALPSSAALATNRTASPSVSTSAVPSPPAAPAPAAPAAPLAPVAPAAPVAKVSAAVPASSKKAAAAGRPVLVRDVYVSGHTRAHAELCPSLGARLRLLVLVTSAPSHAAARDAVRLTWGHYAARADVALAFVIGTPPDALRPALDAEDSLYGDIIEGRFVDSYSNLTLKTLSMLEWVEAYCPRVPHILKTDDDMFVNVPRLLRFAAARANATRTVWGRVVKKSRPKRTADSKYFVSPLQFPGRVFPDFATGPAYLLTRDCCAPLLALAPPQRYVRLEDVFVTGVLAAAARVARVHAAEFYNRRVAAHPCAVQRGVALHMVRYSEQFDLWRKLLDGKTKCAP